MRRIVREASAGGLTRLCDALPLCEGADARMVVRLLEEVAGADQAVGPSREALRAAVADFIRVLPAPNPAFAQWWFSIDTVEHVTARMARDVPGRTALVLGAPSMAFGLALRGFCVTALDADADVVAALDGAVDARVFDAAVGGVVETVDGVAFDAVFTDPPWYRAWFGVFLEQARAVIAPGGHLYCSLLPRLARRGAADDRRDVLRGLAAAEFDIQAVTCGGLGYTVPRFAQENYGGLDDYGPGGWRHGDLIHARAPSSDKRAALAFSALTGEAPIGGALPRHDVRVYRRQAERFRVFARAVLPRRMAADAILVRRVAFETGHLDDPLGADLWSSDICGVRLRDDNVAHVVQQTLGGWQDGLSQQQTLDRLDGHPDGGDIVAALESELGLWGRFDGRPRGGRDAAPALVARAYPEKEDPAAGPFLVDRARIIGSAAFRRQADKARLLPAIGGGPAPSQLMHSLDVMQVAGTIGRALGLNVALIEAAALAYGIGQPPFGSAGASGINMALSAAVPGLVFDPQTHRADLAGLLERSCHGARPGLNLTQGMMACLGGPAAVGEAVAEVQTVRLADRIAGLVADIEHGIALGAIRHDDLLRCRLFHRAPIDLPIDVDRTAATGLAGAFGRARGNVLRVLTEDAIEASALRLAQADLEVEADQLVVDFSARIAEDVAQVWRALQVGRVQCCAQVRLALARASHVTAALVAACAMMPDLVDAGFRTWHTRLRGLPEGQAYFRRYRDLSVGFEAGSLTKVLERFAGAIAAPVDSADIDALVLAKDYVAGLRDGEATGLLGTLLPVSHGLPEGLEHLV